MVSMQPHLSQLGSGLIQGLKALLFVQKGEGAIEIRKRGFCCHEEEREMLC
jgi:hypothetical protein